MVAIILAAGTGLRFGAMTAETPKVLLTVGGATLLERTVAFVRAAGADRIVVVAGYRAEQVRSALARSAPDATVVENVDFRMQNGLSALAGLCAVADDAMLVDTDYVRTPRLARAMAGARTEVTLFISSASPTEEDCMRVRAEDNYVTALAKGLVDAPFHSAGVLIVPATDRKAFITALETAVTELGPEKARLESGIASFIAAGGLVRAEDIGIHDWIEIDTPDELAVAEAAVAARLDDYH